MKIILQPVAMRKPQSSNMPVLEPSENDLCRVIGQAEFLEKYADNPRSVNVNGQMTTTYRDADNLLYIVAGTINNG